MIQLSSVRIEERMRLCQALKLSKGLGGHRQETEFHMGNPHLPLGIVLIALIISASAQAQTVMGRASKETFKVGEEISLEYRAEINIDSAIMLVVEGLKFGSPAKSSSTTIINGVTKRSTTFNFRTTADKGGRYAVPSPRFVGNEEHLKANVISVLAESIPLTEADIRHRATEKLTNELMKPEGTRNYVISGKLGYITEVTDGEAIYLRDLTEKEIEAIRAFN